MTSYLHQPDIDPVLIHLWGPFQIRWYSLLYVGAFILGRYLLQRFAREERFKFTAADMEQYILWALLCAVIGARVIYCVVYDPKNLLANPLYLFQIYRGGLSFHGGLLGVIVATVLFSRQRGIPLWNLFDAAALVTPPGLAMGRIGNFINGELWGRVSYVPWAMVFRDGGPEPRHPSQLYEFFLEGIILMAVLWWVKSRTQRDGVIAVTFVIGYSLCRFIVEFFREPDAHLGYLFAGLTMGQILSLVQILAGTILAIVLFSRPVTPPAKPGRRK